VLDAVEHLLRCQLQHPVLRDDGLDLLEARRVRKNVGHSELGLAGVGHRAGCLRGGVLRRREEGRQLTHLLCLGPGEQGEQDCALGVRHGDQHGALGLVRVVRVRPTDLVQLLPILVDPLFEAPVLVHKLIVIGGSSSPCVVRLIPLVVTGVRIVHAVLEPPLCTLQSCVGLVDLLLQDGQGLSLLGHVGGQEVVPVGLGRQNLVGLTAAEGNHLTDGLLLVGAIVCHVGGGVKGGHAEWDC